MIRALLTCPPAILCNIGITISSDEVDDEVAHAALRELGGEVIRRGDLVVVELPDPADAILAMRQLVMELPAFEVELESFIASAVAGELLAEHVEPTIHAWAWMRTRVEGPSPDPRHGICVLSLNGTPLAFGPPPAIAAQQLPPGPGVVMWIEANPAVTVDPNLAIRDLQPGMIVRLDGDDARSFVVLRP